MYAHILHHGLLKSWWSCPRKVNANNGYKHTQLAPFSKMKCWFPGRWLMSCARKSHQYCDLQMLAVEWRRCLFWLVWACQRMPFVTILMLKQGRQSWQRESSGQYSEGVKRCVTVKHTILWVIAIEGCYVYLKMKTWEGEYDSKQYA